MKTSNRVKVLGLLGLPLIALAVVVVLLSMSLGSSNAPKVSAANPGVDFSMNVRGVTGCDTNAGNVKCDVPKGAPFTVEVVLKDAAGASYENFDIFVTYANIGSKNNPSTAKWPDCDIPASIIGVGSVRFGCAIGPSSPLSTYTGPVGTNDFNCTTAQGTINLVHGSSDTNVGGAFDKSAAQETLTINCVQPPTATPVPPTPTPPPVPRWVKVDLWSPAKKDPNSPTLGSTNLFLTRQGAKLPPSDGRCDSSADFVAFGEMLTIPITTNNPKGPGFQALGGFEFEVRFDPKLICVNLVPGPAVFGSDPAWRKNLDDPRGLPVPPGWLCLIDDKDQGRLLDGIAQLGCVTKGKGLVVPNWATYGPLLAAVVVRPQPELYSQIIANQDNGIPLKLLDQDCKLSDDQGHPIPIYSCEDADITIRYLEGDVEPDCSVNALDQQIVAFAWGAEKGSLLYSPRLDLEPSGFQQGDGDVDIRDLQFVFGRHGSLCTQWNRFGLKGPSWPAQEPENPN